MRDLLYELPYHSYAKLLMLLGGSKRKTPNQSPLAQRPHPPSLSRVTEPSPRRLFKLTRKSSKQTVRDVAAIITASVSKILDTTSSEGPELTLTFPETSKVPYPTIHFTPNAPLSLKKKTLTPVKFGKRLHLTKLNKTADDSSHLTDTDTSTKSCGPPSTRTPSRKRGIDLPSTFDSLKLPISPETALALFRPAMTDFEITEVAEYPRIYFLGLRSQKIHPSTDLPHNNGLDNERGDLVFVANDHLAYRYEAVAVLGKGSFGQVLKCVDHKGKTTVAIKVIRNKKRFRHQATVEVRVLQRMMEADRRGEEAVVRMKGYFVFRAHLCMVFEMLDVNLYEFVKAGGFKGVSGGLVKRFAGQMLMALRFLKGLDIIHCDLKPENILLAQPNRSLIKLIDFGSSCFSNERLYSYIQSRYYRAPEIMLGIPYTSAIDIWSFGCIIVELLTGEPLFTGETELDQMNRIMEVLGVPPADVLEESSRKSLFFENDLSPKRGKRLRPPLSRPLARVLPSSDPTLLSFLGRCFDWRSHTRATPEELLQHPYLSQSLQSPKIRLRKTLVRERV